MFKQLTLKKDARILAVSDIHGNLPALKDVLEKANFNAAKDYLFIVGDIVEKGPDCLGTLRYVMHLAKTTNTHVVLGNCDALLNELAEAENHPYFKEYLSKAKSSVIFDMCKEVGFELSSDTDMGELYALLVRNFPEEFSFVQHLPVAIETEEYIFVHAAIEPREDYQNSDYEYMLHHDNFYDVDYNFPKKIVVGHWGTSLYFDDKFSVAPIIDLSKNIISIDGTNSISPYGQLNCLIIENDTLSISFVSSDFLKQATLIQNQSGTSGTKICFPWNEFEIQTSDGEYFLGYLKPSGNRGYIPKEINNNLLKINKCLVYKHNGKNYIHETMNEFLELAVGDSVRVIHDNGGDVLVCKHNSSVGLVERSKLSIT